MPVDFNIDGQYKVNGVPIVGGASNPSVITLSAVNGTPVTGTTSETVSLALLIPANTFTSSGMLEFLVRYVKTVSAGNFTLRAYKNTSPILTGATQIAAYASGSNAVFAQGFRTARVNSNTLTVWPVSGTATQDYSISASAKVSTVFNTSVDNYILFCVQLFNVGDSAVVEMARAVIYS
jgi:hypothetical protein